MPRRSSVATKTDIKRVVGAMLAAGVKVSAVRVDAGGFTVLTDPIPEPMQPDQARTDAAELEAMLREPNGKD